MDPNRNDIYTILQLPTPRLLQVYRKEQKAYAQNMSDYDDWEQQTSFTRLRKMKDELSLREHLAR